jgi:metal-responsive CopG/Arc/MetJ family transcriptional regulator
VLKALKNIRLTITLDEYNFRRLENEKKKRKSNRSVLIHEMIQYFFERKKQEEKIKEYIKGYQEMPEKINEVAELEKEQYNILEKEF